MNATDPSSRPERKGLARLLWLALGLIAFHSAVALPTPQWSGHASSIGSVQPLAAPARPIAESREVERIFADPGDDLDPPQGPRTLVHLQATRNAPAAARIARPATAPWLPFRARAPPIHA